MASGNIFSLSQAAAAAQKGVAVWWLGQPAVKVPISRLLVRETVGGQVQMAPMGEEAASQLVAAARVDSAQAVAKAVPKEARATSSNFWCARRTRSIAARPDHSVEYRPMLALSDGSNGA